MSAKMLGALIVAAVALIIVVFVLLVKFGRIKLMTSVM